ncbi:MAG: ABC transporter ATP-binding protein [Salinispira sp.]
MLELKNVNTYYGNIHALKDISLTLNEGEIVTLIGANGAGKSSALMSISGITAARSGSINFEGKEICGMPPDEIVRLGIVQVPEGRRIFPQLSVYENLELGAFLRRDAREITRDIDHVFSLFPRLADRRRQQGGTLSGGEQQMLAISRGLMARPRLLLLDEPSLGLAPLLVQQIFEIITRINRESSVTIFLVEQNAHMALKVAARAYVLETGKIIMADSAGNLAENEDVKKAYLGI